MTLPIGLEPVGQSFGVRLFCRESQLNRSDREASALRGLKTTRQEPWRFNVWKLSAMSVEERAVHLALAMKIFGTLYSSNGRLAREAERVELVLETAY